MKKEFWTGLILAIAAAGLLQGCNTVTEAGYYWGSHATSYYNYVKAPNDATRAAYLNELLDIVDTSAKRDLRVPPGIHAEIGFLYAQDNRATDAIAQYRMEVELYPEATTFLERLIADLELEG